MSFTFNKNSSYLGYSLIRPYLKVVYNYLLIGSFFSICVALCEAAIPVLLNTVVNKGLVARSNNFINYIPFTVMGYFLLRSIVTYFADSFLARASTKIKLNIRDKLFAYITRKDNIFELTKVTNKVQTNVLYGAETVGQSIVEGIMVVLKEGLTMVFLLAIMFYFSPYLFIMFTLVAPIIGYITYICNNKVKAKSKIIQNQLNDIGSLVDETCKGQLVLKLYNAMTKQKSNLDVCNNLAMQYDIQLNNTTALSNSIAQLLLGIPASFAFFAYFSLLNISQGAFVGFIFASIRVLQPIKLLARSFANIQKGLASLEQIENCLSYLNLKNDSATFLVNAPDIIKIKSLDITYPNLNSPLIENINITIKKTSKIALLGTSGSGKTSLLKSLMGLEKIYKGYILIDDVNIDEINYASLDKLFSYVGQDPIIFSGSILENIALGQNVDYNKAVSACKSAFAHDFIMSLPDGYDTVIHHGVKLLSGGQLQRINIARAIYKDAPIFILDEITSALDNKSELHVIKELKKILVNKIVIVVSHKNNLLELVDDIYSIVNSNLVKTKKMAINAILE